MNFKTSLINALVVVVTLAFGSIASVASADEAIDKVKAVLKERFPTVAIHSVTRSKAPGWIEVIAGSQVVYFDEQARYMLDGSMVDLKTGSNLTEASKAGLRLKTLGEISEKELLVYQPEKVEHTVTVVTDIDCPYCRKLHSEMNEYLANNIKVRYILMPLKGKQDYLKSVNVWCSDDQRLAMDIAKAGGDVEKNSCDHPLAKHERIARQLGVRGTPAILLEDGRMLPGYVPINELLKQIGSASS